MTSAVREGLALGPLVGDSTHEIMPVPDGVHDVALRVKDVLNRPDHTRSGGVASGRGAAMVDFAEVGPERCASRARGTQQSLGLLRGGLVGGRAFQETYMGEFVVDARLLEVVLGSSHLDSQLRYLLLDAV